jgi:hypothetical protein
MNLAGTVSQTDTVKYMQRAVNVCCTNWLHMLNTLLTGCNIHLTAHT